MINRVLYEDRSVVKVQVYNEDIYILCLDGLYKMGKNSKEIELICDIPEKYIDRRENNFCFRVFKGVGVILSLDSAYVYLIKLKTKQKKEIVLGSSTNHFERGFFLEDYNRIYIITLYGLDVYSIDVEKLNISKDSRTYSQINTYLIQERLDFVKIKYGDAWIKDSLLIFNVLTKQKDLFFILDNKTMNIKKVIDIAESNKQYGLAWLDQSYYTQLIGNNKNVIVEFDMNSSKKLREWNIESITHRRVYFSTYGGIVYVFTLEGEIYSLSKTSDSIHSLWNEKGYLQQFDFAYGYDKAVILNKELIQINPKHGAIRLNLDNIELMSYIRFIETNDEKI